MTRPTPLHVSERTLRVRTTQVRNIESEIRCFGSVIFLATSCVVALCGVSSIHHLPTPNSTPIRGSKSEPSLKSAPELPDDVEPWIRDEQLTDSSFSEPGFYDHVPRLPCWGKAMQTPTPSSQSANTPKYSTSGSTMSKHNGSRGRKRIGSCKRYKKHIISYSTSISDKKNLESNTK